MASALQTVTTAPFCAAPSTSPKSEMKWFALLTRARNERVVVDRLSDRGFDSYLPLYTEVHTWKDRKKRVEVPLFSCYVFVRLPAENAVRYRACNTDGVFGFVGPKGEATAIPDDQIDAVRRILQTRLNVANHPFVSVGQRVRIRGGALEGVEGVLQGRNGDKTLVVSIDAIQRSLSVHIEGYRLEPI